MAYALDFRRVVLHFDDFYKADPSLAPSFVYLDEFDAFYHEKTAAKVVELLRQTQSQVILTTHDSSLLTNELLRPDCAFNMLPEYKDSHNRRTFNR